MIRQEFAPNHDRPFDFRRPPCQPGQWSDCGVAEKVLVKYLGSGGMYLGYKKLFVLVGPFFSNPSLWRVLLRHMRWDEEAIRNGLDGLDLTGDGAILAGHAHYDHAGDLPVVARVAPRARLYVNRSASRMLAAYPVLRDRITALEEQNDWIWLTDKSGTRKPIRIFPIRSDHAPQIWRIRLFAGEVATPWTEEWTRRRYWRFLGGTTYTFVVDLMSDDLQQVRFRIYYNDAAASDGKADPPRSILEDSDGFDLAVLCMPSFYLVKNYPAGILEKLRPRHVMVTHYEDFFRHRSRPIRFVPLLTDRRANRFLEIVRDTQAGNEGPAVGPENRMCGPASSGWTMPLPAEELCLLLSERGSSSP